MDVLFSDVARLGISHEPLEEAAGVRRFTRTPLRLPLEFVLARRPAAWPEAQVAVYREPGQLMAIAGESLFDQVIPERALARAVERFAPAHHDDDGPSWLSFDRIPAATRWAILAHLYHALPGIRDQLDRHVRKTRVSVVPEADLPVRYVALEPDHPDAYILREARHETAIYEAGGARAVGWAVWSRQAWTLIRTAPAPAPRPGAQAAGGRGGGAVITGATHAEACDALSAWLGALPEPERVLTARSGPLVTLPAPEPWDVLGWMGEYRLGGRGLERLAAELAGSGPEGGRNGDSPDGWRDRVLTAARDIPLPAWVPEACVVRPWPATSPGHAGSRLSASESAGLWQRISGQILYDRNLRPSVGRAYAQGGASQDETVDVPGHGRVPWYEAAWALCAIPNLFSRSDELP